MNPKLRLTLQLITILIVGFFLMQPYNWFCQITQKCRPILLSLYLPTDSGERIYPTVNAITYNQNLILTSSGIFGYGDKPRTEEDKKIDEEFDTNDKISVIFHVKNTSKKLITIQPKVIVEPQYAEQYFVRYECPCFRKFKLKGGEEIDMVMTFAIDIKIEKDEKFNRDQKIDINFKI